MARLFPHFCTFVITAHPSHSGIYNEDTANLAEWQAVIGNNKRTPSGFACQRQRTLAATSFFALRWLDVASPRAGHEVPAVREGSRRWLLLRDSAVDSGLVLVAGMLSLYQAWKAAEGGHRPSMSAR